MLFHSMPLGHTFLVFANFTLPIDPGIRLLIKCPAIDQMPRLQQILRGVKVERGKEGKAP